jgi:hypothetical protein
VEKQSELRVCRICPWGAQPRPPSDLLIPAVTMISPEDEQKGEKVYLYTHLRQQPIW